MNSIPEDIGDYLDYDATSGVLRWKVPSSRCHRAGDIAGRVSRSGYIEISFRYRRYSAHRIAWFLVTGNQAENVLDHIDLNKSNNSFANLRLASPTLNNANWAPKRDGLKGVTLHKCGKYQAQVKCRGKNHYLGLFDTEADAAAAYAAKAQELFGEFARAA